MKQCPKCLTIYNDENAFCLNDGATLISQSEEYIPPTVVQFSQGQPNNPPPAFSNVPQQSYQQPQFNQPQNFGQSMPPSGRRMNAGRLIVLGIVLLLGFSSIIGGLITLVTVSSRSSNPNSTRLSNSTSYSQDTRQGEKVGFKIVSVEDATSRHFFPNANKTSAATYDNGSSRLVSFLSVYDSPADAASAFQKVLQNKQRDGYVITSQGATHAYFNKGYRYEVALYFENKLYEYDARNQQVLADFAK